MMQIFATSSNPQQCAQILDDKRVVKMVLESCQLLSNCAGGPYKPTHLNHPCAKWLGDNPYNQYWLWQHLIALLHEYTRRYRKDHKCRAVEAQIYQHLYRTFPPGAYIPNTPVNATTNHQHVPDVYLAYKLELLLKWRNDKRPPTWYGKPLNSKQQLDLLGLSVEAGI